MTTYPMTRTPVDQPTVRRVDAVTLLRRSLRSMVRYPSMTLMLLGMPVVFLLLFVFVFGGTMGDGLRTGDVGRSGRAGYADYLAPGILVMTVAAIAQGTAIMVAKDMTTGIVNRFRTMNIGRSAVLAGHVLGAMIQTFIAVVIVLAVALAVGFRPTASTLEWLGALALLLLIALAVTWLTVALGMVAKSVETASNLPLPLTLLPFLGSGFVPTDSMPTAVRWFAQYQPMTPMIEALRGLLLGGAIATPVIAASAWSVAIAGASYLWARRLYDRGRRR